MSTCVAQKNEPKRLFGIKNSWKYEKDLIIIFNRNYMFLPIPQPGNLNLPDKAIKSLPDCRYQKVVKKTKIIKKSLNKFLI